MFQGLRGTGHLRPCPADRPRRALHLGLDRRHRQDPAPSHHVPAPPRPRAPSRPTSTAPLRDAPTVTAEAAPTTDTAEGGTSAESPYSPAVVSAGPPTGPGQPYKPADEQAATTRDREPASAPGAAWRPSSRSPLTGSWAPVPAPGHRPRPGPAPALHRRPGRQPPVQHQQRRNGRCHVARGSCRWGSGVLHVLEQEFSLSSQEILQIIATRNRLAVAVRGGVAEHHLERVLRADPIVERLERLDLDARPDFDVTLSDGRRLLVECKNDSPSPTPTAATRSRSRRRAPARATPRASSMAVSALAGSTRPTSSTSSPPASTPPTRPGPSATAHHFSYPPPRPPWPRRPRAAHQRPLVRHPRPRTLSLDAPDGTAAATGMPASSVPRTYPPSAQADCRP